MNDSLQLFRSAPDDQKSRDGLGSGDVTSDSTRWYVFSKDLPEKGPVTFLLSSKGSIVHVERVEDSRTSILSDGTKIRDLCVSEFKSWSNSSMDEFLAGTVTPKSWSDLFMEIRNAIASSVYANDDSLLLLTLFVLSSYFCDQFKANPFFQITAGAGSGKSHSANVVLRLSFNGSIGDRIASFGKGSQAAIFRSIALRCTACLDDIEVLNNPNPSLLRTGLLVSYKKATSIQILTERGRPKPYRLYGMKLLTSIATLEPVMASRAISLRMIPAPVGFVPKEISELEYQTLRNCLHVAAMTSEKIFEVDAAYKVAEGDPVWPGRWGEITAGLRCLSKLAGVEEDLLRILHATRPISTATQPLDLRSTVIALFKQGFQAISVLQVWTVLAASGYQTSLTGLGMELSKLGLLRAKSHVVIHGVKSRLLHPNKRVKTLLTVKPYRRPRSFCKQANRKCWQVEACSGCLWERVCPIKEKLVREVKFGV